VIIGGTGPTRTPKLAAKYADEYNVPFTDLDGTTAAFGRVQQACAAAGRHESSMIYSAAQVVCCGRSAAELARRARAIGREPDDLREHGLAGSPDEVAEKIAKFTAIGAERIYLQVLDLDDLDHLALIASEVLPQVS
jgi:alkanesulfonate monooxygenase SsuD/methylene tetrahydromethanopterin reductase-like flavin-dependent oxidoreductase (luciferase family)